MKLGPSIILPERTPAGMEWVRRAGAVKAMGDPSPFLAAKADAWRLFRLWFKDQPATAHAQDISGPILNALKGYRHPRLVVSLYCGVPRELLPAYIPLWTQATALLHGAGVMVGGPDSFSGDYDEATLAALRDAYWCGWDFVFLQGYWTQQYGPTQWNALRWQQDGYLRADDPPLMVTECGWDEVRDGPNGTMVGKPGYKEQGVSAEDAVRGLLGYNALLEQDPRVIAAFPFVLGPTPDWWAFDLEPVAPSMPGSQPVPAPLPAPTPTPLPTPVDPDDGEGPDMQEAGIGNCTLYDVRDRFPEVAGRFPRRELSTIQRLVVHHSVTSTPHSIDEALNVLDAIQRYHTTHVDANLGMPWPAIAYHLAIDGEGRAFWCNGFELTTYHAGVANPDSIGVVLLGTYTTESPAAHVQGQLRELHAGLEQKLGRKLEIVGHKEIEPTTLCPGSWWEAFKRAGQPSEVPAEWRQYGATWPEVAANLKGTADLALGKGREIKTHAEAILAIWGSL